MRIDGSVGIASYGGGEISDDLKYVYLVLKRFCHDGADAPSKLHSRDVNMRVLAFQTVQFLKEQLVAKITTIKDVRPSDLQLIYRGTELKGKRSLDEYDISGTADKPCVLGYYVRQVCQNGVGVDPDDLVPMASSMREKLAEVQQSLLSGIFPRLTDDGTGGTYKIYNRTKRNVIAMFKPRDEEAFAPNNPRNYIGIPEASGIRPGTYSTLGASREVAAYLLDHDNFANVPRTAHVHMMHPSFCNPRKDDGSVDVIWKTGSLQEYVNAHDHAGNMSPTHFMVQDCHRVGILDLRIINMDRNDGNLLIVKTKQRQDRPEKSSRYSLVPIDHGLSFPDRLEVAEEDIVWMGWPQAKEPFGEAELQYIQNLSWEKDQKMLVRALGLRKHPLRLMWVTYRLLQLGASAGLTLFQLGEIVYRTDFEEPSTLQRIIEVSVDAAAYSASPTPTLSVALHVRRRRSSVEADEKRQSHISVESLDLYAGQTRLNKAIVKPPSGEFRASSPSAAASSEQSTPPPCMLSSPRAPMSDISLGPTGFTDEEESTEETGFGGTGTVIRNTDHGTGRKISTARQCSLAAGGIFSRPDPRTGREGLNWTSEMEKIFRDHCEASLKSCVELTKRTGSGAMKR
jgi:hypothetical protein